jgi:hypothetical protein
MPDALLAGCFLGPANLPTKPLTSRKTWMNAPAIQHEWLARACVKTADLSHREPAGSKRLLPSAARRSKLLFEASNKLDRR